MKRKNILWGFAMLIIAMVVCWACSSCGDDKKDEPSSQLVGAWKHEFNPTVAAQLEAMIVAKLQEEGALTQENIQVLQKVKEIVSTIDFIVQFKDDGEARLYAYGDQGVGVFVTGSWLMTDDALLLQVRDLVLAVTNLKINGKTLTCTIGDLPLTFKKQ